MTDIFISYNRHDVEVAKILSQTLEALGYTVWWDMTGLHGGQTFAKVIQQKLSEAKCAIVLWSPDSVASQWVHAEASFADKRGILLTAMYRESEAPMPFNNRHNENLRGWAGNIFDEDFQKLLEAIDRLCPVPSGQPRQAELREPERVKMPAAKATAPAVEEIHAETVTDGLNSGLVKKLLAGTAALGIAAYWLVPKWIDHSPVPVQSTTQAVTPPKTQASQVVTAPVAKAKEAANRVYQLPNNLTLLPISAGSFRMGSNNGDNDEKPVHKVTIAKPFWMSETEITFDQYDAYATATGKAKPEDRGWGRGNRPVINVSWQDTQGYVKWLSQNNKQGLQCRLPSEAEWEYAARAGTTTAYYWGDKPDRDFANYSFAKGHDKWVYTAPVKQFKPNGFGLYDMSGNVWEWVQDRWHKDYTGTPQDGSAWETGSGASRVLRGGSWDLTSNNVRSAFRSYFDDGGYNIGFRVVCSPIDR